MIKKVILGFGLISLLYSCGLSNDNCELAVRQRFEGQTIWVKGAGSFNSIVLTKDSVLIYVESRKMYYPYISKIDTLIEYK